MPSLNPMRMHRYAPISIQGEYLKTNRVLDRFVSSAKDGKFSVSGGVVGLMMLMFGDEQQSRREDVEAAVLLDCPCTVSLERSLNDSFQEIVDRYS